MTTTINGIPNQSIQTQLKDESCTDSEAAVSKTACAVLATEENPKVLPPLKGIALSIESEVEEKTNEVVKVHLPEAKKEISPEESRLIDYLTKEQGKSKAEAEKMAREIRAFIEPRLSKSDEPQFYFSTENKDVLPRTIHILPEQNLTLVFFNKRRDEDHKRDKLIGDGASKYVDEAYDYKTGKVYARVVKPFNDLKGMEESNEREKKCAEILEGVPCIVKTYASYQYTSPKTGKKKVVAIQEKIVGDSLLDAKLSPEQKCATVKTLLKTLDRIHAKGVIHGDLHARNVLIDRNFQVKIIDFDDSKIVKPEEVSDDWRRGDDMFKMAGLINFLSYGIMNCESGKNFIETLGTNKMSAKEALEAFDKLLETPGFSESIQETVAMDDESLASVFLGS